MCKNPRSARRDLVRLAGLSCLLCCAFALGCQNQAGESSGVQSRVEHNLSQLSPEDRRLAEQQKYCAVETDNELGSMGVPVKVVLKGQPVFLCCKGCRKTAEAEPDRTLAMAKTLREAGAAKAKPAAQSGS